MLHQCCMLQMQIRMHNFHTPKLETPPPVTREVFQVPRSRLSGNTETLIPIGLKPELPPHTRTYTRVTASTTTLYPPSSLTTNTGNSARNWVQSVMKTLRCIRAVYPPPISVKLIIGHISMQSLKYNPSRYITPGKKIPRTHIIFNKQ